MSQGYNNYCDSFCDRCRNRIQLANAKPHNPFADSERNIYNPVYIDEDKALTISNELTTDNEGVSGAASTTTVSDIKHFDNPLYHETELSSSPIKEEDHVYEMMPAFVAVNQTKDSNYDFLDQKYDSLDHPEYDTLPPNSNKDNIYDSLNIDNSVELLI